MSDVLFAIGVEDGRADILTNSTESVISVVDGMGSIKVKGHYWDNVEDVVPSLVEITPILSGNSYGGAGHPSWGVYIPSQNEQIGCVGQTMKQVTHLIATMLASSAYNVLEIGWGVMMDMSFDHVFLTLRSVVD
jgi:hypothetical protein